MFRQQGMPAHPPLHAQPAVTSADDPNGPRVEPVDIGTSISLDDRTPGASSVRTAVSAVEVAMAEETLLAMALDLAPPAMAETARPSSAGATATVDSLDAMSSGSDRTAPVQLVAARRLPATDAQSTAGGTGYATAGALIESASSGSTHAPT